MSFRNGMPGLHLFPALQGRERKMTTVYVGSILVKPVGKIASRHSWGNAQRYTACAAALSGARTVVEKGCKEASFQTILFTHNSHNWVFLSENDVI